MILAEPDHTTYVQFFRVVSSHLTTFSEWFHLIRPPAQFISLRCGSKSFRMEIHRELCDLARDRTINVVFCELFSDRISIFSHFSLV